MFVDLFLEFPGLFAEFFYFLKNIMSIDCFSNKEGING